MKKMFPLLGLSLLLASCDTFGTPAKSSTPVNVTIVGLNDFHGNLNPTAYTAIQVPNPNDATKLVGLPTGGIEVIGTYLAQERAKTPNLAFIGLGDIIGASPVDSSLLRDEPTLLAMNKLGMRLSALGNHEFDQGLKELQRLQNGGCDSNDMVKACKFQNPYPGAGFKYIGANVLNQTTGKTVFEPYQILDLGGAKIAFVSSVTKTTPNIVSPDGVAGLSFTDEADAINKWIPEIKEKGADAIVALIHEGAENTDCAALSGAIVDITKRLDKAVNVVMSAHSHKEYNCQVDGRTVIQGDFYGHMLQRVDLTVTPSTGKVEVQAANVLMDTRTLTKNAEMTSIVSKAADLTKTIKQVAVGTLASDKITQLGNAAGESALGDVIADAMLAATRAQGTQIAFMNPGGIRADLIASAAGNTVTFGDLYAVHPFGNTLTVMDLTGTQIKALLEEQFDNNGIAGKTRILQVSNGFSYSYDATAAKGSRVDASSLKLSGEPLDPAKTYRIVTNSFLAGGGDAFATFKSGTNVMQLLNLIDVDVLGNYVKANAGLVGGPQNRITKTK